MAPRTDPHWSIDTLLWDPAIDVLGHERTAVLRLLISLEPASARVIASHTQATEFVVQSHLDDLARTGVLRRQDSGTFIFNEAHVLTRPLLEVLDARTSALTRIVALAAETVTTATTVALYTPTAPNTAAVVIVHTPNDGAAANELGQVLRVVLPAIIGHRPTVDIIGHGELRQRIEQRDTRALRHWWRSHTLHGPELSGLMVQVEREFNTNAGEP
jgi:hypothetical protein